MSSANQSLKQNRALIRRSNHRSLKNLYLHEPERMGLTFKEVSPEQLVVIKNRIRLQHKLNARKDFIVTLVTIFLTVLSLYFLYMLLAD